MQGMAPSLAEQPQSSRTRREEAISCRIPHELKENLDILGYLGISEDISDILGYP